MSDARSDRDFGEACERNSPHESAAIDAREETILRLWLQEKTLEEIGWILGVTKQSVMRWSRAMRARGINLPKRGPGWVSPRRAQRHSRNEARNERIRELLSLPERPSYQVIADELGISRNSVSSLMRRDRWNGLLTPYKRRWNSADDARLREGLALGADTLARRLGRTSGAVKARATKLSLVWPQTPHTPTKQLSDLVKSQ